MPRYPQSSTDGAQSFAANRGGGGENQSSRVFLDGYGNSSPVKYCGLIDYGPNRDWKFIKLENNERGLYDLRTDPYELTNVASAYPEVVTELSVLTETTKAQS